MPLRQRAVYPWLPHFAEKQLAPDIIERSEARIEFRLDGSFFQKRNRERMERGYGCRLEIAERIAGSLLMIGRRRSIQQHLFQLLPEPDLHFARCLFGKRDCADPGKRHRGSIGPLFQYEVKNPVQERARFPGAGRSFDDKRPACFFNGSAPRLSIARGSLRLQICSLPRLQNPAEFAHGGIVRLALFPLHPVFSADRQILAILAMTGRPDRPASSAQKMRRFRFHRRRFPE